MAMELQENSDTARSKVGTWLGASAIGRFVLRIANALVEIEMFDRAMTLAAQAFTSILPLVIVVAALREGDAKPIGAGLSNYLGLNGSAAAVLERVVPAASDVFSALGWFGILLLIVSATAFSRALERFYCRVWSKGKSGFRAAWRPFAVIATILLGLVALQFTRSAIQTDGGFVAVRGLVVFVLWTGVWLLVGWLLVIMCVVVIAVTAGHVLTVDYGVLNRVNPRPSRW